MQKQIAELIRLRREQAGISQRILAERCGWSRAFQNALENKRSKISIEALRKIAKGLGLTLKIDIL